MALAYSPVWRSLRERWSKPRRVVFDTLALPRAALSLKSYAQVQSTAKSEREYGFSLLACLEADSRTLEQTEASGLRHTRAPTGGAFPQKLRSGSKHAKSEREYGFSLLACLEEPS